MSHLFDREDQIIYDKFMLIFLKKYFFVFVFLLSFCLPLITIVHADAPPPPCYAKGENGGCATVRTGLGDIGTNFSDTVSSLFLILLGFAGAVAVILIIFSGYNMMLSEGNPEKVKSARETLTSAIVGLLFILFSGAILQIIGVDILKLPGFGK